MPKAFPPEFRRDVAAVARKGQPPPSQIARDFGISESCLHRWLNTADVEDGYRPGVTSAESAELREVKRRNRMLEQEVETLPRAAAYFANHISPGSFVAPDPEGLDLPHHGPHPPRRVTPHPPQLR